jgi:Arylsulfotransferase (ASST)
VTTGPDPGERGLTRSAFLGRAAGAGAACLLAGRAQPGLAALSKVEGRRVQQFVSRPDLLPPVVTVVRPAAGTTAAGLLFLAPSSGPGQRGAMIVDNTGEVVWFHPTSPLTVMNFRMALYQGKPVLTWWEGKTKNGLGIGEHVIFDQSYRELARFPAGNHLGADLHELILSPTGTAFVTAYDIPTVDRSSVGKGRGRVIEGVVQELELPSARVLFEWRSLDHVRLNESYAQVAPAFDYFHINSIDVDTDGSLLVSARNTWAIYKIDRSSGAVTWRLGGKKSDFAVDKAGAFAWQHDARWHEDGRLITLFDNAAAPQVQSQSRGLALALDSKRMRATLVHAYAHRPLQLAHALGSVQQQPNGNILVGWGTEPYFTEYSEDGAVLFDARLPRGGQNYRTLRFDWTGAPKEPPRLASPPGATGGVLYASWNGATTVAAWQLLTGASVTALTAQARTTRLGFETALQVPPGARFAKAVALDANGKPLGLSPSVEL